MMTLLDLSSAFDTIDHYILFHRLRSLYGVSGTVLSWFEPSDCDCQRSEFKTCGCFLRCPKGLNPWSYPLHSLVCTSLLFLLKLSPSPTSLFADDTQLFHSCPPDQAHAVVLTTLACISGMKTWTLHSQKSTKSSELCSETGLQITQT